MNQGLLLVFTKDKIVELLNHQPDKIVASVNIEERRLDDGQKGGVLKVQAHAMRSGQKEPLATVDGCPVPPCEGD